MGFWGIVFACFMLPAIGLCLASKRYMPIGIIMFLDWMAYTIPFREFVGAPDTTAYFVFVCTVTAIPLCFVNLTVAQIIVGLKAILLGFVYFPQSMGYITTHESKIASEVIGYLQILAMAGGAGGYIIRRHFTTGDFNRRAHFVGFNWFQKSD